MSWNKIRKNMAANWQLYVLILPTIVYVFLFNYVPMAGVQIAFKNYRTSKGIWGSPWVGLDNFIRFVQYPNFWKIIRNTLSVTLYSLVTFPIPILVALQLNELRNERFKKTVQMVSYAPHFISTVVVCSMLTLFFNKNNGVINHMIAFLGGARRSFMTEPESFSSIYVWSGVWQNTGWDTIIYLSALSAIPMDMYESAQIDGANRMQIITHINIPSILSTIVILFIMRCGSIMSLGFEKVYLLQNSLNLDTSEVISTYVYQVGLIGGKYSYSAAISLFNNVINILLLLSVNAISRKLAEISVF